MPTRTTRYPSLPGFVVDPHSTILNQGRQVDWDRVSSSLAGTDGKKVIKAGTVVSELGNGKVIPRLVLTLTGVVVASNVATATLAAHGLEVGDVVVIAGANLAYVNGTKTVASVPDANTFTFAAVGADATATGTITSTVGSLGILVATAVQDNPNHALTGYGIYVGGVFYETLLPDSTGTPRTLPAAIKTELGARFVFETYSDVR